MKNLKKLFVAAIMLVVALTAVVSSTYAWFTMQNQVDVDEMTLNVGTAGLDLQVSLTNNVNELGYSVAYQPVGKLVPVTFINGALDLDHDADELTPNLQAAAKSFKTMDIPTGDSKYTYVDSTVLTGSTLSTDQGYIQYDLYFRSSDALDLELDLDKLGFSKSGDVDGQVESAVKSIRIMFKIGDTYVIYEPHYDATSTYGTGRFFEAEQPYASSVWSYFMNYTAEVTEPTPVESQEYTLKATFNAQKYNAQQYALKSDGTTERAYVDSIGDATTEALGNRTLEIGKIAANTMTQVTVYIWLEGWDGDAINVASGAAFNTHMVFKGFAQGKGN